MKTLGFALLPAVGLLLFGGALSGCGPRPHIHPDHGRASYGYWSKQRLYNKAEEGVPRGLDSEEAALIHANYRKQHGGAAAGEGKDSPSRVLLLQEDKGEKK
jgi:hypothetical protein